jgi:tetratricopeptide (TPR) repeat protein
MRLFAACAVLLITATSAVASSYDDFGRGLTALEQDLPDEAIHSFSAAIAAGDLSPSLLPQAYRGRAQAYMRKQQCRDALPDIDAAIKLENTWESQSVRGDVEDCLENFAAAEAAVTGAIALKEMPALYWSRGRLRLLQKDFDGAIADFNRQAKLEPNGFYARLWLELARLRAGTLDPKTAHQDIGDLDTLYWPGPLLDMYAGDRTPERVLATVKNERTHMEAKQCDADFFIGLWWAGHGDAASAKPLLQKAASDCEPLGIFSRDAQRELKALN